MNPWTQLAEDAAAKLAAVASLAPIPRLLEDTGDINAAIDQALANGGVQSGATGKVGMCLALAALSGRANDLAVSESQDTILHLELITRPSLNGGELGHQLLPSEVFFTAVLTLRHWDRGYGRPQLVFSTWARELQPDEVILSADFIANQFLTA